MKTHQREILIYYNPESNSDRKTVAHAQSVVPHVRTYAFGKTPSTTTSWQTILNALEMHPKEILNNLIKGDFTQQNSEEDYTVYN